MGVIVGERIDRLFAERKKIEPTINITIKPEIKSIDKEEAMVGGEKKAGLTFCFIFSVIYGKDCGKIEVEGSIFYSDTAENIKKIESDWKKDKKISDAQLKLGIMNHVLEVAYAEAFLLAKTVRLPPPIQLPRFMPKQEELPQEKKK